LGKRSGSDESRFLLGHVLVLEKRAGMAKRKLEIKKTHVRGPNLYSQKKQRPRYTVKSRTFHLAINSSPLNLRQAENL
jgi:hypothetical protein